MAPKAPSARHDVHYQVEDDDGSLIGSTWISSEADKMQAAHSDSRILQNYIHEEGGYQYQ